MAISSQILTPTVVTTGTGRTGIVLYDNPNVTNNNSPSAYVLFGDMSCAQLARAGLTQLAGSPTGPAAFDSPLPAPQGIGPGQ